MKNETLKLALVIEEFDRNNESLPLELLKPIAETLRALAQRTEQEIKGDGHCQACDGALCTAKKGCVALSNLPQQKPLKVDKDGWFWLNKNECIHVDLIRKIEAAHGIKE